MILYDYLFYCSYKMGMRSGNFEGLPVLAGMMMVTPNAGIHLVLIQIIPRRLGIVWIDKMMTHEVWGRILYLSIFALVYLYYLYKGRYKRIIEKYNSKNTTYWKRHPFVTIVLYTLTSFVLFILAMIIDEALN